MSIISTKNLGMGVGTRGVFFNFFQIFHIKYLARFSSKIENLLEFTLEK
jgi:hypothetical protein